jgi:hypothetical protein
VTSTRRGEPVRDQRLVGSALFAWRRTETTR